MAAKWLARLFRKQETMAFCHLHTSLVCCDCGAQAHCYDHRDYNEPLRVDSVCRSCNVLRGEAIPFNPYIVGLLLAKCVNSLEAR